MVRRKSAYFIPIAQPKKKSNQPALDSAWTEDRLKENDNINYIRRQVELWREQGYRGHHADDTAPCWSTGRTRNGSRLYFCQIEALETLIFLNEVADKTGKAAILNDIRERLAASGTPLLRLACKMATGTGKTIVMAMLVAYHTLNKRASPNDRRFSDAFLVVSPGITIRDRLRVSAPVRSGRTPIRTWTLFRLKGSGTLERPVSSSRTFTASSCGKREKPAGSRRPFCRGANRRIHRNAGRNGSPRLPGTRHAEGDYRLQ